MAEWWKIVESVWKDHKAQITTMSNREIRRKSVTLILKAR